MSNVHVGPFGKDDRRQCFNVNILNDTQSENSEYFMVNIQFCPGDQPERVDINPSRSNTTIIDDDGKLPKTFGNSKSVWSRAMEFQCPQSRKCTSYCPNQYRLNFFFSQRSISNSCWTLTSFM